MHDAVFGIAAATAVAASSSSKCEKVGRIAESTFHQIGEERAKCNICSIQPTCGLT